MGRLSFAGDVGEIWSKALILIPARFDIDDCEHAYQTWKCSCGPTSLAVLAGLTLDEIRPYLGDFERKGYLNPTLMFECLNRLGLRYRRMRPPLDWPAFGLVRVQWEGPWTAPGVPIQARYRHTHLVASMKVDGAQWVFDHNCMCVGGWVSLQEWDQKVVPWLLKECEPKADGKWHITHSIKIERLEGTL